MNSRKFSEAMSELDSKYVDETINYKKKAQKPGWIKWGTMAACLAILAAIGGIFIHHDGGMAVKAYACETDEEITAAGAVISTGTISDNGEMKGHPLMFYLSGKDIKAVRFSCKNQQINFMDWTETRDEYGNAQNFTVTYGEDESEYYYLTIDWVPNTIIRALTDNAETAIATLPAVMREDIIVMEIAFINGKTATKAITVSLMEDGRFFAAFDDYKISDADDFIKRTDSVAIPRNVLYGPDAAPAGEGTPGSGEPVRGGATFDMPQVENDTTNGVETTQPAVEPEGGDEVKTAEEAAKAYYSNTVFEVVSLELKSQTENEIIFSVCVSKGGEVQEPNRTIMLQLNNETWEVINEGY